jgi:hypothetical protein
MTKNQKTGVIFNRPELGGDVKCFESEAQAMKSPCKSCRKVVFAKTGDLEDSAKLIALKGPIEEGQVPNNTIGHGSYNYITKVGDDYIGLNWAKEEIGDPDNPGKRIEDPAHMQRSYRIQDPTPLTEGRKAIWCRRCVNDTK